MRITVLIPTFDNGALIRTALDSVFAQTYPAFEVMVVADGSPTTTHEIVSEYSALDPRVTLRPFPKGDRHGEAHRHEVLATATTDAVCYLSDDDFWFPDHLRTMAELLETADFAHTRQVDLRSDLTIFGHVGDLADPETRKRMQEQLFNFLGLSVAGHRLDAYRRLVEGWAPAPPDVWTDLHMWRKWLAMDGVRFCSSPRITGLHRPRAARHGLDLRFLANETRAWYELCRDPSIVDALSRLCPADTTPLPFAVVHAEARRVRDAAAGIPEYPNS